MTNSTSTCVVVTSSTLVMMLGSGHILLQGIGQITRLSWAMVKTTRASCP